MRVMAGAVVLALTLGVGSTAVGRPVGGVERKPYEAPNGVVLGNPNAFWTLPAASGVEFVARPGDRTVQIDLEDRTGLPVLGYVEVDRNYDGSIEIATYFCDVSKPLRVKPGATIWVAPVIGQCKDGTITHPTRGIVNAIFN